MEWITKTKFLKCKTNKEALESAYQKINSWCENNGFKWSIQHNSKVDLCHTRENANRTIKIYNANSTYIYKLTVSACYDYETVEEETKSLFNKKIIKVERAIPGSKQYYAWLQRM